MQKTSGRQNLSVFYGNTFTITHNLKKIRCSFIIKPFPWYMRIKFIIVICLHISLHAQSALLNTHQIKFLVQKMSILRTV
jgi:hypothetical protein